MTDQAFHLRRLAIRSQLSTAAGHESPPQRIGVIGGDRGLGTTTVAAHLSLALVEQGMRVVLVDADPHRHDVARFFQLPSTAVSGPTSGSSDDIHELLQRGPHGVQIVPYLWNEADAPDERTNLIGRRMRQFRRLGRHAETLVLDLGGGTVDALRSYQDDIDEWLLVASPESQAIMQTYAFLKSHWIGRGFRLVVNRARDRAEAVDVFFRVDRSCKRFLGRSVSWGGFLPHDEAFSDLGVFSTTRRAAAMTELAAKFAEGPTTDAARVKTA